MKIHTSIPHVHMARIASAFLLSLLPVPGALLAAVAQAPYAASVESNVMFILDDSGSMQFEVMPDDYTFWGINNGYVIYLYPRATGVYGSSDYSYAYAGVATVDDNNAYNALMRSHHVNRLYYNPAVTYLPWKKHDGSSYPNATPDKAYHNPENTAAGSRNLTATNTYPSDSNDIWHSCTSAGTCTDNGSSKSYWPATYFYHNSGLNWTAATSANYWVWGNYTRVKIESGNTYSGHCRGGPTEDPVLCKNTQGRTDCADKNADGKANSCTYQEEIQNFANWYTYYRSRILTARAGVGRAFADQGSGIRVGYGAINNGAITLDGVSTSTISQGVRVFAGTDKQVFFTKLYEHDIPAAGTPLRKALNDAGKYYSRTDDKGPWSTTPGVSGGSDLVCRQSYTILMTDGYWTYDSSDDTPYRASTSDARLDNDSNSGSTITGPNGATYTYSPRSPFEDNRSNTLADVSMYYWKRDLRTDLSNEVPTNSDDPAFWQHMVTYGIGLGVSGTVDPEKAFKAMHAADGKVDGNTVTWPNPVGSATSYNNAKLDDLLHASVNSRGKFFSAQNPEEFADALSESLADINNKMNSASALASNTTKLSTGAYVYQAKFDADWSGHLLAHKLKTDGTIDSTTWDAAEEIPIHSSRKIFTWNGTTGTTFTWSNLSSAQRALIDNANKDNASSPIHNFLRGDSSLEGSTYRKRGRFGDGTANVLGDIVNSDPLFVSNENYGYRYIPGSEGTKYPAYLTTKASREKMIYVGANDGMLHAFKVSDGSEQFAYVPDAVMANLASLSSLTYSHKYFVDGSPVVGDAYLGGNWKTILLGTTGAGGKGVFALDVSSPTSFSDGNVLWEFAHATDLGYTIGQPVVARLNNGKWAAIFGNGYESSSGLAKLFVVFLDANAGDGWTAGTDYVAISTNTTTGNGLSSPSLYDSNGDGIVDYAYAGDLKGNLWKFDLTSAASGSWTVANKSGTTNMPLFTARSGTNTSQPITAPVEIGVPPDGRGGVMVTFGTGSYYAVGDNLNNDVQSFYGIWDNYEANNQITYSCTASTCNRSTALQEQVIKFEGKDPGNTSPDSRTATSDDVRVTTDNQVDFDTKRGWYIDLVYNNVKQGERVTGIPILRHGRVIFTTVLPNDDDPCDPGSSWLMELSATTGARLAYSAFDMNNDDTFDNKDFVTVTLDGVSSTVAISSRKSTVGIIDTPAILTDHPTKEVKFMSGSTGNIETISEKTSDLSTTGRVSWHELMNE